METREKLLERIFYKMVMIGDEDEYLYRPLGKQDVYDILSAETKEQQKCEYCHDKYGNASTLKMYLEDTGKQYEEEEAYLEKIRYCEVCGRHLE